MRAIHILALQCALLAGVPSAGLPVVAPHAVLHNAAITATAPTTCFREVVRRVAPSVVMVIAAHSVEQRSPGGSDQALTVELGSGIVARLDVST